MVMYFFLFSRSEAMSTVVESSTSFTISTVPGAKSISVELSFDSFYRTYFSIFNKKAKKIVLSSSYKQVKMIALVIFPTHRLLIKTIFFVIEIFFLYV